VTQEIACSLLRPPKTTATRIRSVSLTARRAAPRRCSPVGRRS
jgi:hypothetical protein